MAKRGARGKGFGGWAFLIGLVIAIVLGVFGTVNSNLVWILVVLGLVIGILNISAKETHAFLFSGTVLIIASAFGQNVLDAIPYLGEIFQALLLLFIPATILVAVRHMFMLAKD